MGCYPPPPQENLMNRLVMARIVPRESEFAIYVYDINTINAFKFYSHAAFNSTFLTIQISYTAMTLFGAMNN